MLVDFRDPRSGEWHRARLLRRGPDGAVCLLVRGTEVWAHESVVRLKREKPPPKAPPPDPKRRMAKGRRRARR